MKHSSKTEAPAGRHSTQIETPTTRLPAVARPKSLSQPLNVSKSDADERLMTHTKSMAEKEEETKAEEEDEDEAEREVEAQEGEVDEAEEEEEDEEVEDDMVDKEINISEKQEAAQHVAELESITVAPESHTDHTEDSNIFELDAASIDTHIAHATSIPSETPRSRLSAASSRPPTLRMDDEEDVEEEDEDVDTDVMSDRISSRSSTSESGDLPTPTLLKETPTLQIHTSHSPVHSLPGNSQHLSFERSPVSPLDPADLSHLSMSSMTSITLSQSSLDLERNHFPHHENHLAVGTINESLVEDGLATPRVHGIGHRRRPSSLDIVQNRAWADTTDAQDAFFDNNTAHEQEGVSMSAIEGERHVWARESLDFGSTSQPAQIDAHRISGQGSLNDNHNDQRDEDRIQSTYDGSRRPSNSSSNESREVDWSVLDKNEEQEKEDRDLPAGVEDESTAFLLARLELENAKFSADPKSAAVHQAVARARANSARPSINQLKRLVQQSRPPSTRYSVAPSIKDDLDSAVESSVTGADEPPPMTELEFWTALVQDYPSTASRLPTLTTSKIRSGIPPPLRGVVWTSIAGARDAQLASAYETLRGERSPYEGIINKDVGRSFPGVELFRDADGEGQKMLGRVLKCFSLQDSEIGYCQGLGFLVGPLLMNMGEREAFCVLVRLMDHYSLRPSFLPSLSGLHMRIYQFSSLLKQHNPLLFQHLADLGVEPAYLSQWFLSCFAVTCPLPMLFRIYDVIFAEGANETVMRVALALMRRHEARMLASHEFEDIMQLLLGREIWDCYGGDADVLVDDFTSLGDIVTFARLAELEREFDARSSVGASAGFLPNVQAAASGFLGRLWASGQTLTPSKPSSAGHGSKASVSTLSPASAERDVQSLGLFSRPSGFLRRSPSKQSITVNTEHNSSEDSASSSGGGSLASTAPTDVDALYGLGANGLMRESMADSMSMKSKPESIMPNTPGYHSREQQQELHAQIEDLLTALSEMQREHAQLAAMLQKEREERNDDHNLMRQLAGKLRPSDNVEDRRKTLPPPPRTRPESAEMETAAQPHHLGHRRALTAVPVPESKPLPEPPKDEMAELVEKLETRLHTSLRFSTNLETKAQLRSTLARTREQLTAAESHSRDLNGRLASTESALVAFQTESDDLRAEVKELRTRVNDDFRARQKLEHQLSELKAQARSVERRDRRAKVESMYDAPQPSLVRVETSPADGRRQSSISSLPPSSAASAAGLRELKLVRRGSASILPAQIPRHARASIAVPEQAQQLLNRQLPTIETSTSSPSLPFPMSPDVTTPGTANPIGSGAGAGHYFGLGVGGAPAAPAGFSRRTSSLVTQEVFATTQHEAVPEEALLLELVNAKTSEAQARQEVDELKRALAVGKRQQDAALLLLRTELAQAQAEATRAARAEQDAVRQLNGASTVTTPSWSLPPTPAAVDDATRAGSVSSTGGATDDGSPGGLMTTRVPSVSISPPAAAPSASGVSGWFWNRRSPSTSTVPVVVKDGA